MLVSKLSKLYIIMYNKTNLITNLVMYFLESIIYNKSIYYKLTNWRWFFEMYFFGVICGLEICFKFRELCLSFCFNKNMETVLEKDVNLDLNGFIYLCEWLFHVTTTVTVLFIVISTIYHQSWAQSYFVYSSVFCRPDKQ